MAKTAKRNLIYIMILGVLLLTTLTGCRVKDYGLPMVGDRPQVATSNYLFDIGEGLIPGHSLWYCYGYNPNVAVTDEVVWELSTTYTFPSAPMQMEIVSTSAEDGAGGFTGALTAKIYYLDGNYNQQTEMITLTGLAANGTVATNIYRVNGLVVYTTGSTGKTVGNISLQGFGGGAVYSYILAGRNTAKSMIYTVPANHTLYVTSLFISSSDATEGVKLSVKATYDPLDSGIPLTSFVSFSEIVSYNDVAIIPFDVPLHFPGMTDIKSVCVSGQAGAEIVGSLKGWLEDELEDGD